MIFVVIISRGENKETKIEIIPSEISGIDSFLSTNAVSIGTKACHKLTKSSIFKLFRKIILIFIDASQFRECDKRRRA